MVDYCTLLEQYIGKKVLVTGHTGFKGSWLCEILLMAGAEVIGYALESPTDPNLFSLIDLSSRMNSVIGDIRDLEHLQKVFEENQPEIVIHMAAQPLVRDSYEKPVYTYDVNVMGTVNVLECVRHCPSVKSVINVTTDKVYLNKETGKGFTEDGFLCGYDPYSNSKSCSELVTYSYKHAFFSEDKKIPISTMRAGNVIGGGDFSKDRIVPDCVKAAMAGQPIIVRNPYSVRPFQHVIEPLMAYLMVAIQQIDNPELSGNYNIGPDDVDCISTEELTNSFCEQWTSNSGVKMTWVNQCDGGPHEAQFLRLNCQKVRNVFNWEPKWSAHDAIQKTIEWTLKYMEKEDGTRLSECMRTQVKDYCAIT